MPIDMTWHLPIMCRMDAARLAVEIEEAALETGLKVTTVCQLAFGDARRHARLIRRIERIQSDAQALHTWLRCKRGQAEQKGAA